MSIGPVIGEKGILANASNSVVETRASQVKEAVELWKTKLMTRDESLTKDEINKSRESKLDELIEKGLLKEEEKIEILENENYEIKIGSIIITFNINEEV